ncbi:MAG: UvrD-helicase domain-containing protein, partial [Phycisphaerae bacterium]|nr:UvrD-helicase domain-containing protein [Phycisphaerae bacterium]
MSGEMKLTAAQKAAAVDRIGENIALRSGAGCGKTLVLARRFTELLLKSGGKANPLARFVALTFTDKAALEMKQRVRRFLTERAAASKGEDRRRLLG